MKVEGQLASQLMLFFCILLSVTVLLQGLCFAKSRDADDHHLLQFVIYDVGYGPH